ncbi:cdc18 [Symbiodinium necroappetens]|uniref:Cdc18 protein n=1 Tax=Symbiodinium necroappetens TaxID=1628268 RepID=A0A812NEY5_9DINO|nr:cdc18 [Symbiodinium necroappetens]
MTAQPMMAPPCEDDENMELGKPQDFGPGEPITPQKKSRFKKRAVEHDSPEKTARPTEAKRARHGHPTAAEIMLEAWEEEVYPLVSRERECGLLDEFLKACLESAAGSCIYLSGGPGTGKTSVARAASKAWLREHPDTRVLEINCMENLRPCSVPGFLLKAGQACSLATGKKQSTLSSRSPLSSLVASAASSLRSLGKSAILIIDEVDQLVKKWNAGDTSLEILCDLPRHSEAPALAIIMIANHVDLLVQACGPRWKSVCSSVLFERYTLQQFKNIVQSRFAAAADGELAEKALGGRAGLELRIRRLANAGDCRHIVRLCDDGLAKAEEMRQEEGKAEASAESKPGGVQSMSKMAAMQTSLDPLDSLKSLPLPQQLLLCALSSVEEPVLTSEIFQRYLDCLSELKQSPTPKPQVLSALSSLEQRGLLSLQKPRGKGKGRGKGRKGAQGATEELVVLAVCRDSLKEALQQSAKALLGLRCLTPDPGAKAQK